MAATTPASSAIHREAGQVEEVAVVAVEKKANITQAKLELQSEIGAVSFAREQHKVRLQSLRKELNHITTTEWLYDPIEKLTGRGNQ